MRPDVRKLVKAVEARGASVQYGGKHLKVVWQGAVVDTLPITPSDWRWRKNAVSNLMRLGVLDRDPWARVTKAKEVVVGRTGEKHRHYEISESERGLAQDLFSEIAAVRGLKVRAGRKYAHGTLPELVWAVERYLESHPSVVLPRVIDSGTVVERPTATEYLCKRLMKVAGGQPQVLRSTAEFIPIAIDAWSWLREREERAIEEIAEWKEAHLREQPVEEDSASAQEAWRDEPAPEPDEQPLVVGRSEFSRGDELLFPGWEPKHHVTVNGSEKALLAIEVAAAVGGDQGVALAKRVLSI